jgi:uncharacterized membrane protein YeaQ/YmgE (transglycosylase-associated protein family)
MRIMPLVRVEPVVATSARWLAAHGTGRDQAAHSGVNIAIRAAHVAWAREPHHACSVPLRRASERGLIRTALVGLAGSFLGGLVARYAIGVHYRYSLLVGFVLAVIFAAIIVAAIDRRPYRR